MIGLAGVKQCDALIKAATSGDPVNMDDLPKLPAKEAPVQQSAVQVRVARWYILRPKFWYIWEALGVEN
jgi:hypothetical protein